MRGRRSVIVAVALVLGVVAGGAAYAFLHNVQQRAYNGAKLADVYVASGTIPKGASGAAAVGAGLITKSQIPAKFRPAGTVSDLATIQGQVATADIPTGQVVVAGLFASPATVAGTAAQSIPKGDVAITVSVDPVHGVANLPQPGDQVDILFSRHGVQEAFLYQNVPVLAVGTTLANHPTQATATAATTGTGGQAAGGQAAGSAPAPAPASNLVTFAVPPDAAARIAYVQEGLGGDGGLYLALVPPGSPPVAVPPPVDAANVLPVTPVPH